MPAARTNRLLLLAAATIGVVAGAVGIGASILGDDTEAERSDADPTTDEPVIRSPA